MASITDWFKFKSPAQREAESRLYKVWAYPYGDTHKEKIDNLIHEFIPEEDPQISIYNYLVCRQVLYPLDKDTRPALSDEDFLFSYKGIKKKLNPRSKKLVHKYMALVDADLKVSEQLVYPSIEELAVKAQEIKNIVDK